MIFSNILKPPFTQLTRNPFSSITSLGWMFITLTLIVYARMQFSTRGAERVLLEGYAAMTLPLIIFGIVGATLGKKSLQHASSPIASFGIHPMWVALAYMGVALAASGILTALLGASAAYFVHESGETTLRLKDMATVASISVLGAWAYTGAFTWGATFGLHGGGRIAVLALDWILGSAESPIALLTPRAHLYNLFGGLGRIECSPQKSSIALGLIALITTGMALKRVRS